MFSLNGCTVTFPDGTSLRRQKAIIDGGTFTSYEKRTGKIKFETEISGYTQLSKNRVEIYYESGTIVLAKSGCGCGR
jgi:hypothetical protein